ncbi:MAG TPA: HNH endonuclease [Lacunisphaera sp.]|nr:HNH endonuclease [Lacunisphaera sp.]
MSRSVPFCYPVKPHVRKHGPTGYKHWDGYRDWLRDEFDFQCVFCLRREVWDERRAVFAVEHLIPRKCASDRALDYNNLVYACGSCNSAKSANIAPDPCTHAYGDLVVVETNGKIRALNAEGKRLIRTTRLDDEKTTRWREMKIGILRALAKHDPARYRAMLDFPPNLPDLTKLIPPGGNAKPGSEKNSRFHQRLAAP